MLGVVARARNLLRVVHRLADSGDAAAAALPVRAITESVLTLGWFDRDPELAEAVSTFIQDIYTMNADGTDRFNVTESPTADDTAPDWGTT